MIQDTINVEIAGGLDFSLSKMVRVQQKFNAPTIDDIESAVQKEFTRASIKNKVSSGQKIAVGCGSRGHC
ncbi:MAG TPA: hypothetical protein DEO41_01505 [Betaproteobacteria bacterium]|nr:hypothetical protein [Betaproteobacteria bacterium]